MTEKDTAKGESRSRQDPEIVTYRIPKIEVYQVTDAELIAIETGHGQVGQDFTMATVSITLVVAFLIALVTGTFSSSWQVVFEIAVAVCALSCVYTGVRWWQSKGTLPKAIASIRSRKVAEEVLPPHPDPQ